MGINVINEDLNGDFSILVTGYDDTLSRNGKIPSNVNVLTFAFRWNASNIHTESIKEMPNSRSLLFLDEALG